MTWFGVGLIACAIVGVWAARELRRVANALQTGEAQ